MPSLSLGAQLFADALEHQKAGRLVQAESLYKQVLAINPRHADTLHLLGVISYQTGRPEPAVALIRQAIAIDRKKAPYHNNLGRALEMLGRLDEAVAAYRKAIELKPDYVIAYDNLGGALWWLGQPAEAARAYRKSLDLKPGRPDIVNRLGLALGLSGQPDDAILCFRNGLAVAPRDLALLNNLGNALRAQGRFDEAASHFRKALEFAPTSAETYNNLGVLLLEQGRLDEAETCLRKALDFKRDYAETYRNLGNLLYKRERFDEAIAHYQKSLALQPDARGTSTLLTWLHYSQHHTDDDILAVARNYGTLVEPPLPPRVFSNRPSPNRRLRIGYVSADFRTHPVGFFLERVLKAHDPAVVEIFCYSNTDFADEVTERLQQAAHHWRNIVTASDRDAAALIEDDAIDILVDLAGHTDGTRLSLFALQPAPVQVTWLGFYGTTGLSRIDYILADRFVAPPDEVSHFTEQPWRLPGCYLCYSPHPFDIPVGTFPAIANGFVTFGSFNKRLKISDDTMAAWAKILRQVEGSRLFLKNTSMANADSRARLTAQFADLGIAADRLILEGHSPVAEGLAAYNRVDIALDPFPFGGGTTTADTLWMGVPLVALKGARWVGRMSHSIMAALNLEEWVADNTDDYVALACRLAAELPGQPQLRGELRARVENSAFCDGASFTRGLEEAYRGMWHNWCAGRDA
jgi:predicted O-linked N-acetylglucosamine transferase (SPINDLY family)